MRYDYTIIGILLFVFGFLWLFLWGFHLLSLAILGPDYGLIVYPMMNNLLANILQFLINWRFVSPIVFIFGLSLFMREGEIRQLEAGAHRTHQVNRKSIRKIPKRGRHTR